MRPTDLLVLAAVLLILSPAAHATVESTCKAVSGGESGGKYDFCVKTLQSDPASATADLRGHAVIATSLSSNKAAEVFAKIQTLLQSSQDKDERMCLSTCSELYDLLISDLDKASSAIKESRKDDAITALSSSLDAPDNCEMAFEELSVTSPLAADDNDQSQLCRLALQIGSLALN
ncbi:putative invertase inhibitor [Curcuma longa]|uniref:putative invertase inhibitor n=1 Tax=Curcuma longa TaxID=136217 RepID=UPI003D9F93EB